MDADQVAKFEDTSINKNDLSTNTDIKIKATSHNAIDNINHDRALSEISFFYEHGEEDESDENDDKN